MPILDDNQLPTAKININTPTKTVVEKGLVYKGESQPDTTYYANDIVNHLGYLVICLAPTDTLPSDPESPSNVDWEMVSPPSTIKKQVTITTSADVFVNQFVNVDASGGEVSARIPTAVGNEGRQITFVKIDSSANAAVLDPIGIETIIGQLNIYIVGQWDSVTIESNGVNWLII